MLDTSTTKETARKEDVFLHLCWTLLQINSQVKILRITRTILHEDLRFILDLIDGIRNAKYLLKTPGNTISETLNFKMTLDATALKNLCLWCSKAA